MAKNFIITGAGGQGVVSAGMFLASVFMFCDKKVTFSSSYGAEMRGGAVSCEVCMDENEIYCLHDDEADYIITLNQSSFDKFVSRVKKNGTIIVNSSLVESTKPRDDIEYVFVPLTQMAADLGSVKFTNSVALGVLSKLLGNFSTGQVKDAYQKMLKDKSDMVQKNVEAYLSGYDYNIEALNAK